MNMISTDILGTLYTPGTYDAEGNAIDAPAPVDGYHVNTTHPVADWAAFKVTTASPRRVFGGGSTHYYTFADAAEFEAELDTADMSIPVAQVIPQSVTMRQACIQLEIDDLLDDVEAIVATLPRIYQIEWQRASVVLRDNLLVETVRQQKGMTSEQIDALFIAADAR